MPGLKRAFEPRSPGVKRRLQAMEKLASAGILAGTSMMPVIPCLGDDEGHTCLD
jgi:DNA repair photolyase